MGIQNLPFVVYGGSTPQLEAPNSMYLGEGQNISLNLFGGTLTVSLAGVIDIANGGTNNGSLNVTAGGVIYVDGSAMQSTGPGQPAYSLFYPNSGSVPIWRPPLDSYIYSQGGA